MEEIVFPIPEICRFLTEETKKTTFFETEMDDKDSKIADFFERSTSMYREMAWQKKLQGIFSKAFSKNQRIFFEEPSAGSTFRNSDLGLFWRKSNAF